MRRKNLNFREDHHASSVSWSSRWKAWFYIKRQAWILRSSHRFYRCKQCKTYARVPKGKGKIQITCPKCGNKYIKKT